MCAIPLPLFNISLSSFSSLFPLLKLCNYRTNYQPREPVLCARRFISSQAKDVPIACFVQPPKQPFLAWPKKPLHVEKHLLSTRGNVP